MANNKRNIRKPENIQEFLDANYEQYVRDSICSSIDMDIEYSKACALISIAKSLERMTKEAKTIRWKTDTGYPESSRDCPKPSRKGRTMNERQIRAQAWLEGAIAGFMASNDCGVNGAVVTDIDEIKACLPRNPYESESSTPAKDGHGR